MDLFEALLRALVMAGWMGWQMLWALVLGFFISGAIQAVVSHKEMARLLPDSRPSSLLRATGLGVASSSCSYAAVAIARAMVRKGADFTAAMIFQFASTNLVLELGLALAVLMGWRFTAATWVGGALMIVLVAILLRLVLRRPWVEAARQQADKDVAGRMEGHAAMDMSVSSGPLLKRIVSADGITAAAHYFWMDWAALWVDIAVGLLVAGAVSVWVPHAAWAKVFAVSDPGLARIVGPLVGPLIGVATFVCSVGNVPLAAVLWNGGASFGGVVAFIFADLIVLPILDIYRRYYGLRMATVLFGVFYLAMAMAGYAVEALFGALHLIPSSHAAHGARHGEIVVTAVLNGAAILLAAALLLRFLRTGGPEMLRHMNAPPDHHADAHEGHRHA
jgi:uncharacterized protein